MLAGGYRAIDSLRLEKGYRVWAADITPDESPFEAGLGFCVRDDKHFIGSDALAGREMERRLRCVVLDDPRSVALGNEPVRIDGRIQGRVTTGGYGYTVARSIAYAYLPAGVQTGESVQIDIFGQWVAGEVSDEPLFDPQGDRVRRSAPRQVAA
jgi:4-methylaminobutanoate oxidase (formaldehyde-forming)